MGKLSRTKGHAHERAVAAAIRARFPHLTVRRSLQSHQAFEPDVVVEGVPLWLECFCGAKPNPLAKLAQAERDVERFTTPMYPAVVWRKSGSQTTYATMRLETLLCTMGMGALVTMPELVVTVEFDGWLCALDMPELRAKEAA